MNSYSFTTIIGRPTLLCSGRRWRGLWARRDFCLSCRAASRADFDGLPAAPLKAGVGRLAARKAVVGQQLKNESETSTLLCAIMHT